jgi:outer membrane autotransporter protein
MLQPFASLLYTRLREESLEESGADSLNMKVDSRRIDSLISELGLRLTRPVEISKGTLIPEISAAWQHDFAVDDRTMAVSFTGAPSGFTLEGRDQDRNGALVGVGLTLVGKGGFTASVRYNGEFRSSYDAHGVSGQIRFSF